MPKRAGNGTGLALPRSPVCSILLILQNLMYWSAFQLAKSPSVGGDRWGHHTLIERRLMVDVRLDTPPLDRPWSRIGPHLLCTDWGAARRREYRAELA